MNEVFQKETKEWVKQKEKEKELQAIEKAMKKGKWEDAAILFKYAELVTPEEYKEMKERMRP